MIERKKGTRRDIVREGEKKREVKGAQSKLNPSPNSFPKLVDEFIAEGYSYIIVYDKVYTTH